MILPDKINIKSHYRILENEYRQFLDAGRYSEAQEALQKMINLIKNYRILFNDPDDRIQILQIRRFMILYREERLRGSGMKVAYLLREVANLSTPDACLNESCLNLDTQKCISKRVKFSHRQAKMCIEKINAICTALKIEAAVAARGFDYQQALEKRRMAVNIHEALLKFDPNIKRVQNHRYLEYWYYITEGYVLLLKGQFAKSKEWFAKALEIGRSLDQKRCFPNYFKDLSEIRAHEFYIDAIENVQSAQFGDAREKFQAWIDLSINQERKNDLRYDNILFFEMVCSILERLRKEEVQRTDWDKLERFLDRRYIARTTWALWLHLQWLRELSFKLRFTDNDYSKFDLQNEIDKVAQKWELFIPDAVLLGEDRIAGLKRPLNLPYFFNIFDQLEPSKHNWQQLLLQNLKNLFLLVADYEYMRYWNPPPEEAHLPQNESATLPSEKMKTPELIQLILFYLDHRSEKHVNIFKNALSHLDSFKSALEENDFTRAVAAQRDLLERMRFLPHVILVKEQEKIPEPIFLDEDNPNFLATKTTALRFGQKPIGKTIFEGPQNLKIGSYYYLRPSI